MNTIETELKRWTVLDTISNKFFDITDSEFNEGLQANFIKLRGQYIKVENGHKIWIDGAVVK